MGTKSEADFRDQVAELRWLATRLELLGGPMEPTTASHTEALTRMITAQAIRVIAAVIEYQTGKLNKSPNHPMV
jgi:hypothetical protein